MDSRKISRGTPSDKAGNGGYGLRRWMTIASLIIFAVVLLDAAIGVWKLFSG